MTISFNDRKGRGQSMGESYSILDGAEEFFIPGNDVGVLLIHGFLGTPQSVQYLGNSISEFGYTVYAPRLSGHGTHYRDLEKYSHGDWIADVEKSYSHLKKHCSTIFVMGQSMGGTLTLWLANKNHDIKGIILINAALRVPDYKKWAGLSTPRFVSETAPDIKDKHVHEITYSKVPIRSIHALQSLMKQTPDLVKTITNPILCFKSSEDHIVPKECTDYIIKNIGSKHKEVITLYDSFHVASMDFDKDRIIKETHRYIQENIKEVKSF